MIKNLVASCLLATNVNTAPIKRDNQQWQTNYTITLDQNNVLSKQTKTISYASPTAMYKVKLQAFTDYLTINATIYYEEHGTSQYLQCTRENNLEIKSFNANEVTTAQGLLLLEITPTNYNINNNLTWYIETSKLTKTNPALTNGAVKNVIVWERLQTTRNIQNYMNIDIENTTQAQYDCGSVYNAIKYITGGYQTNITNGYTEPGIYQDGGISLYLENYRITPNKTNYYAIIFQCRQWYNNQVELPTHSELTNGTIIGENINTDEFCYITGTNVISNGTQEIVDIPGTMLDIVGMPFTFISTAFNLTLFPGTNYEINISLLFLTIFALLSFLFVLKLFLRMKG